MHASSALSSISAMMLSISLPRLSTLISHLSSLSSRDPRDLDLPLLKKAKLPPYPSLPRFQFVFGCDGRRS